jgi:superfamily II DNA or RNA helicase
VVTLRYYKGLLLSDHYAPGLKWNEKFDAYVSLAYKYREVLNFFREGNVEVEDSVMDPLPFPFVEDKLTLREYQERALGAWLKTKRGVIVIPTGGGKTAIAIKAMTKLKVSTLVVVPTLELIDQWYEKILTFLGTEPGRIGGGYDELKGITVITYDSAYTRAEELGNKFYFVVFDEVHHLPSEGYSQIAELMASPYRMGLSATVEREDGRHVELPRLVGPVVFRLAPKDLVGKYIAPYEIKKVYVELTEDEKERYKELRKKLKKFLEEKKMKLDSLRAFHRLLYMSAKSKEAREALLAWHEALRLAVNSRAKIEKLREILKENPDKKIIVFTRDVEMCYAVSREFLIPAVTYVTPKDEREEIMRKFKENKYRVIAVSNVFDEGVDIPDADMAVVLGGYGTSRQFIQRLGRILRKSGNKRATLFEIVTKGTSDYNLSKRRSRAPV